MAMSCMPGMARLNQRQEDKNRSKQLKDLCFLVLWLEEQESLYDTLSARDVIPPVDVDVLQLMPGTDCKAVFEGKTYNVQIVGRGKYPEMKSLQLQKEDEAKEDQQLDVTEQQEMPEQQQKLSEQQQKGGSTPSRKPTSKRVKSKVSKSKSPTKKNAGKKSPKKRKSQLDEECTEAWKKATKRKSTQEKQRSAENERISQRISDQSSSRMEFPLDDFDETFSILDDGTFDTYPVASPPVDTSPVMISDSPPSGVRTPSAMYSSPVMPATSHLSSPSPPYLNLSVPTHAGSYQSSGIHATTSASPYSEKLPTSPISSPYPPPGPSHCPPQFQDMLPPSYPPLTTTPYYSQMQPPFQREMQDLKQMLFTGLMGITSELSTIKKEVDSMRSSHRRRHSATPKRAQTPAGESDDSGIDQPQIYTNHPADECILGNPRDPPALKLILPGRSQAELRSRESICKTPQKLALSLLSWLFTKEQLGEGICTPQPEGSPASSRTLLDQKLIEGIRLHVNYKFPKSEEEMTDRWSNIVHKALNTKCRNVRFHSKMRKD